MVKKKVDENDLIPGCDLIPTSDLPPKKNVAEEGGVVVPSMTSPAWSDYAMSKFEPDELADGRPTVAGLRRVVELLLGPIVASDGSCDLHCPIHPGTGLVQNYWVATHCVQIAFREDDPDTMRPRSFTEVGNVNGQNVDVEFIRWGPEFANTRAEARALRKALKLKVTMSAEENAPTQEEVDKRDAKIESAQINFIYNVCERNGIDQTKYINFGENRYAKIQDVPYGTAIKMIKYLTGLQNDQSKIPDGIKK